MKVGHKLEVMTRGILWAAVAAGTIAFLAMLTATAVWMTIPERIIYRESSPTPTPAFSAEVKQHATSFYVTPAQKKTLDRITNGTPVVWFGALGVAVAAILAGAAARLRLPFRT
jgi:hypothetical protein